MRLAQLAERLSVDSIRSLLKLKRRVSRLKTLQAEERRLRRQLTAVERKIRSLGAASARKRRSRLSAAARERIRQAQKKRCAAFRSKKG